MMQSKSQMKRIACQKGCEHHDLNMTPLSDTSAMATCDRCGQIVTILNDDPGPELGINPS